MAPLPNLNWIIRHHRVVCPLAWVAGTMAITALFASRVDASAIVVILVFFAIVVAGLVAGFVSICKHRLLGLVGIVGWVALPVLHGWTAVHVADSWAPTVLADLAGVVIAALAAFIALFAALAEPLPASRWARVVGRRDRDFT